MKMNVLAAASKTRCVLQCFEPLYAKKVTSEKQHFFKKPQARNKKKSQARTKKVTSE